MIVILRELREQTQQHHSQVEDGLGLMSQRLTLDEYVRVLKKLYGFYKPLEEIISSVESIGSIAPDYAARRNKFRLIENDLRKLSPESDLDSIRQCENLPEVRTPGQALGSMYVLEGATLGGQIITRHLAHTLLLSPSEGSTFFSGYGSQTASMWKRFQSSLMESAELGMGVEIIRAAKRTFESLAAWVEA